MEGSGPSLGRFNPGDWELSSVVGCLHHKCMVPTWSLGIKGKDFPVLDSTPDKLIPVPWSNRSHTYRLPGLSGNQHIDSS